MKSPLNTTFGLSLALGIFANPAMAVVTIDYVPVGNPNNAAQVVGSSSYGAVSYSFQIARNEVTVDDYVQFLNAVAKTSDPNGLYNASMGSTAISGGISKTTTLGVSTYAVRPGYSNTPVTFVRWFDAARFANWMHNGQPTTGVQDATTTENGAYTLLGNINTGVAVTRNVGATVWIPSENEWYKAAYYDPNKNGPGSGGYWNHATQTNTLTTNTIGTANSANFTPTGSTAATSPIRTTTVGAYLSSSDYGTNDQAGNVRELTDTVSGSSWVARGGDYSSTSANQLISTNAASRTNVGPTAESATVGFRLATLIPEPSTALLTILAIFTSVVRRSRNSN
jgi:formylglycine-generating enzyme